MNQSVSLFNLSQHDSELAALAAEVGIDWQKSKDKVHWDDSWKNNLPVTDQQYKGKVSLISSIKGRTRIITFRTLKHGGESRTWTNKSASPVNSLVISGNQLRAKKHKLSKDKLYARLNQQYLDDWKTTYDTVEDSFPYLKAKQLTDIELRLLTETRRKGKNGQKFMAIPVYNQNQLVGLQRIYKDGQKAFTPGTPITGSYYKIGRQKNPDDPVYICEGWATGQTIHNQTGCAVYCTFNAGNLQHVAEYLLKTLKSSQIIIAADNDCWKVYENTGLSKALDINYRHRIRIRYPNFDGLGLDEKKPTDFNDLFCLSGAKETSHQLTKARKSCLNVPSVAFKYRLKKLVLAGEIKSPNNKTLRSCIGAAFRKGFSDEKITRLISKTNSSVSKDSILKILNKIRYGHSRRVARCHTIDPKAHPDVEFTDLPLTRQDHGGYLINESFYGTIKDFRGVVVIKAPMASGKTETIIRKALDGAEKGSYQAHRISLVEESSQRLGIQSYRDVGRLEMSVTRKMGCCINSLNNPKFGEGDWFLDADVVCIDEGTKVFQHLTGSTVDNPEEVTDTFIKAVSVARQVIICDADANDTLVSLLSKHSGQKIRVAQASPAMDHVDVTMTSLEEAYRYTIEKALSGETVLCACDSKKDVERLKLSLAEKNKSIKVLDIFSESKVRPEVDAWIKNPNAESPKYDVVIYNSAVDSGVSITTDHFRHQTGLFRGIISPDSVIQMMGRNRPAKSWYLGCSPMIATRYGDDVGDRFRALAAANLRVHFEAGESLVEMPQATTYDQIRLTVSYADMLSRQDYLISLRMMLEQKGYKTSFKEPEEALLKSIREEMSLLGQQIRDEFVRMVLDATTPQQLRYRQLKQSYAVSKEELAEITRYDICHNLCTREITEEDVLFWLDNGDRKELSFEIMQADRQLLFKYDHWQTTHTRSLTRRKHLLVRGDILHQLFGLLGVDRQSGEGFFTHRDCDKFIDFLLANKNRIRIWNYYHMGQYLSSEYRPKDPTRFVQACLKKLGLTTKASLHGKSRTSRHEIDQLSWKAVRKYTENRKKAEKHISDIPPEFRKKEETVKETDSEPQEVPKEAFPEAVDSCYDCDSPLDPVAIRWAMDRCHDCRSQILDTGG